MNNPVVMAAIHLHAVIRNIEDLCALDAEAQARIAQKQVAVRFLVPHIEPLTLRMDKGQVQALRGSHPSDLDLRFTSPEHLNGMIAGTKMPIPTKGLRHLSFLKNDFVALAARLAEYLKPTPAALQNQQFRDISTLLTAYTAFFAAAEIAAYDPAGQACAQRMEDGDIQVSVGDKVQATIEVKDHRLRVRKGPQPNASAFMHFDSMATAGGILRGELDSYACIGRGQLSVGGRIPLVDNLNKLLGLASQYLS